MITNMIQFVSVFSLLCLFTAFFQTLAFNSIPVSPLRDTYVAGYGLKDGRKESAPSGALYALVESEELVRKLQSDVEILKSEDVSDDKSAVNERIETSMSKLENMNTLADRDDSDPNRFEPLLGLYDVTHVQTAKQGDNPVGGKWTRKNKLTRQIFNIRRTFQHLLPTNSTGIGNLSVNGKEVVGEAVNVISLDALFKLIRLTVILRGDAVPLTKEQRGSKKLVGDLTNLTVRAFFDSPRITLGKRGRFFNICLGPPTSVVLDSTYADDTIRIGKGGSSGSRFIFTRCPKDDLEAQEFRHLLIRKPTGKPKLLLILGLMGASGLWTFFSKGYKLVGGIITLCAALSACAVSFSTGGVEDDRDDTTLGEL